MSRIGKLPIAVPDNIKIVIDNDVVTFDTGKVARFYRVDNGVRVDFSNKKIRVFVDSDLSSEASMFVGMNRSNIQNIVFGLQNAFKTNLEINGVGYKASVNKNILNLTLGYSHEIFYVLPPDIQAVFEKPNLIIISGNDNVLVGQVAAEIISFRRTEPYKGKGVKVYGRKILRKEGKKK